MPRLIQLKAVNYHTLPPYLWWFLFSRLSNGCSYYQIPADFPLLLCIYICLRVTKFMRSNKAVSAIFTLLDFVFINCAIFGKIIFIADSREKEIYISASFVLFFKYLQSYTL